MSSELLCLLFLLQAGMVNPIMVPLTLVVFIKTPFAKDHIQPKISQQPLILIIFYIFMFFDRLAYI